MGEVKTWGEKKNTLLQKEFSSFIVHICNVFFIHSFAPGQLGYFNTFIIVSSATIHTGVQKSLWEPVLNYFG